MTLALSLWANREDLFNGLPIFRDVSSFRVAIVDENVKGAMADGQIGICGCEVVFEFALRQSFGV